MLGRFREYRRLLAQAGKVARLEAELQTLKAHLTTDPVLIAALGAERATGAYKARRAKPDPLVTICIATYNRGELVVERAVGSLLAQTHRNIEIVVVGDHCTDDTERRLGRVRDSRLRFVNLPERGRYPEERERRWMVAGTVPMNVGLSMAEGDFVTHLDDDDRHAPERIETLLQFIRSGDLEVAYHPFRWEQEEGWSVNQAAGFALGSVTTSSVLYDRFFARIPWDMDAYLLGDPGDWNRLRKFAYLGARIGRCAEVLLEHFMERSQRSQ